MRKNALVRLGVAAALSTMGVAGAVGSGCNSSSVGPGGTDSGTADGATSGGDGGPGQDSSTPPTDSGPKADTGVKDSGPPIIPANLVIAHIAPGVPPIRVCFATGTGTGLGVTPINALPDGLGAAPAYPQTGPFPAVPAGTPGIYPGTIGAFPVITDLQPITITPFAILSSSIANDINFDGGAGVNQADGGAEEDCVKLIGTHGLGTGEVAPAKPGRLTLGVDFFPLASIPDHTLLDGKTYLLTVNGCLPGGTAGGTQVPAQYTCGPAYDGGVSANIGIAQLDTATAVADGGLGIQFAHRSTAIENTPISCPAAQCGSSTPIHDPAGAGVWPTLIQPGIVGFTQNDAGPDGGDAGTSPVYGPVPTILGDAAAGGVKYSGNGLSPEQTVALSVTDPTQLAFGVFVLPLDGGTPNAVRWPGTPPTLGGTAGDLIALPFSAIQLLSSWNSSTASAPTGFVPGASYTFILQGDPVPPQLPNPDGGPGLNPQYDGRGVHIVAFPNVFTPKSQ